MTRRQLLMSTVALAATALAGRRSMAQGLPDLDRAMGKSDPGAELLTDFNELVSAVSNIAPPSDNADQDRAKVAEIRALLQDPANIARARDPNQRVAAETGPAVERIPDLAARLDQGIGSRLSADARAGVVNDFKTVAGFMEVVRPGENWYCEIYGLLQLLPC